MWDTIWIFANSNLGLLLIGSGLGFLFVRLVWEPYKERQEKQSRRLMMREEALFRLTRIESEMSTGRRGVIEYLDGGMRDTPALDPIHSIWSLHGLIFAGWGSEIAKKCYPYIDHIKEVGNSGTDRKIADQEVEKTIDSLKKLLNKARTS